MTSYRTTAKTYREGAQGEVAQDIRRALGGVLSDESRWICRFVADDIWRSTEEVEVYGLAVGLETRDAVGWGKARRLMS